MTLRVTFYTVKKELSFRLQLFVIKLHSGDEHVTYMDKLDGLSLWRELVKNTVEGVCQECIKQIRAIALCII